MKRVLLIVCLFITASTFAQKYAVSLVSYPIVDSMKLRAGVHNSQYFLAGLTSLNDGNGGIYMYDSSSTKTADNFKSVQVTGQATGRYLKVTNNNVLRDSATFNGILATAYNITFPIPLPSAPAMIIIQAYSANAAQPSWVSNESATGFTANFAALPVIGTNNIKIKYTVIKY